MLTGSHEEKVVIVAGGMQWYAAKTAFDAKILNPLNKKVPGLKRVQNGEGEKWEFNMAEFLENATYDQAVVVANSCREFHRIIWSAGERARITATLQPVV